MMAQQNLPDNFYLEKLDNGLEVLTIEDNTVIYAGTTILGGDTVIGHDSTIGGNVWLTQSIEPYSTVINQVKIHMKNKKIAKICQHYYQNIQ